MSFTEAASPLPAEVESVFHRLAVVIPYYHGEKFIRACLDSIKAEGVAEARIYIVENSVRRGGLAEVAAQYPGVRVLEAPPRLGFGKACNLGAKAALADGAVAVAILNQDLVVGQHCLPRLLRRLLADPALAMVAPLNFSHDFQEMEGFYVKHYLSECPALVKDAIEGNLKPAYPVPKLMGSSILVKSAVIDQLGLFDELYFMYCEDDDLCRRYRAAGLELAMITDAAVGHAHSHTSEDRDSSIDVQERESHQVFNLKSAERSFLQNWIRVQRQNWLDYFKLLTSFRFGLLGAALASDVRVMSKLARIRKRRQEEMDLTRNHARGSASSSARSVAAVA